MADLEYLLLFSHNMDCFDMSPLPMVFIAGCRTSGKCLSIYFNRFLRKFHVTVAYAEFYVNFIVRFENFTYFAFEWCPPEHFTLSWLLKKYEIIFICRDKPIHFRSTLILCCRKLDFKIQYNLILPCNGKNVDLLTFWCR